MATNKFNRNLFLIGLAIFYLILFFSPKSSFIFGAYFIIVIFFYLATKDLRSSLIYSLILSFFSDANRAGEFFLIEPRELNQGPAYWISPMTLLILSLLLFSFRRKLKNSNISDIIVILFFTWSLISFFFFPYNNVLFGIISLCEILLAYFLLRIHLKNENFEQILLVILSLLAFQSIIGVIQFILKRPINLLVESYTTNYPYGLTAAEDENLYRLTGTFTHPNNFAAVLLVLLPFLLLMKTKNLWLNLFKVIALFVLFFTYSRAAWVIMLFIFIVILFIKRIHLKLPLFSPKTYLLVTVTGFVFLVFLTPYLIGRINTIPQALEEKGSIDVRFKLFEEGLSLISQYPITGVGLNQGVVAYTSFPITNILEIMGPNQYYRIHNVFLEIASEIGIPGLIFFLFFLITLFRKYFLSEESDIRKASFLGLLALIGMSMLNPFFHTSQFRLFFLLSTIILVL